MISNNPNKINQPSKCCIYCGKCYEKKINLNKHIIICELLNNSKKSSIVEDYEELPSQRKLYQMLLELGNKYNKLEEKMDKLNKCVVKKKKISNVIEVLNENFKPDLIFDNLIEKIVVVPEDILYLINNSFVDTLNQIFTRNIFKLSENKYPLIALNQNLNILYIYENDELKWIELNREKLVKFLNKIYIKLFRLYSDYKKDNIDKINNDEKFADLCDELGLKLTLKVDFGKDIYLNKIKNNIYLNIKIDID
jgi:dGTP triphosphohydrolase